MNQLTLEKINKVIETTNKGGKELIKFVRDIISNSEYEISIISSPDVFSEEVQQSYFCRTNAHQKTILQNSIRLVMGDTYQLNPRQNTYTDQSGDFTDLRYEVKFSPHRKQIVISEQSEEVLIGDQLISKEFISRKVLIYLPKHTRITYLSEDCLLV